MEFLWLLGALGMISIEISYLPQLIRLHRRKCADDVSVFFPALNLLGRLMAMSYALILGQAVLGAGFLLGVFMRGIFLGQVLRYRFAPEAVVLSEAVLPPSQEAL